MINIYCVANNSFSAYYC